MKWSYGVVVSVAVFGLVGPASADDVRLAHVTVEGVLIGPAKKDLTLWDTLTGAKLGANEQQTMLNALGSLSRSVGDPYTAAVGTVVTELAKVSAKVNEKPDAQGSAELFIGGRLVGSKIKLPKIQDSFTPQWPGRMEWSHVPIDEDVRIRITLEDADVLKSNDPIGVVIIDSAQLQSAAKVRKVVPILVADQSDNQIIAVKVSVMFEAPEVGSKLPPECDEYGLAIQRLMSCKRLPQETRDALKQSYEQVKSAWAAVPPEGMAALGTACKSAADAVRQSAAECPE